MKGPYGFDLAPQFWIVLEEMSNRYLLARPRMVYDELSDAQDDLASWAQERKKDKNVHIRTCGYSKNSKECAHVS